MSPKAKKPCKGSESTYSMKQGNTIFVDENHWSWVLGSGSWVLGPRSWVLGPRSWVLGPRSWVLGPRSWVLDPGSWILGPRSWVLGPVSGSWVLVFRYANQMRDRLPLIKGTESV